MVQCLPTVWETWVRSLSQEDPLEKEMATHSSTLAWNIPWMEERNRLQSMGSQRVGHDWVTSLYFRFPHSSAVTKSTCNAADPGSIPGLGRSTGEGIDYPLQYSWASLVAQLEKNAPAMQETWVWSLGWEDHLEKGTATHSSILAFGNDLFSKKKKKKLDFFPISHSYPLAAFFSNDHIPVISDNHKKKRTANGYQSLWL